jgi:hypothetical protein
MGLSRPEAGWLSGAIQELITVGSNDERENRMGPIGQYDEAHG